MKTAHTPGPLSVEMPYRGRPTIRGPKGEYLGETGCGNTGEEPRDKANANLWAAAPDLLEALRECITEDGAYAMTDEGRSGAELCRRRLHSINSVARAAIAKATER